METSERRDARCLAAASGGRGSVRPTPEPSQPRPLLPPAPGSAQPLSASREDRARTDSVPSSWTSRLSGPGACTLSTLVPETRGVLGTHGAQRASGARAPAPQAPDTDTGEVTGTVAGGPQTAAPSGRLTVHFRNPGFLPSRHSRRPSVSAASVCSSRLTPSPILTCSVGSGKPASARKDRRTARKTCRQEDARKPRQPPTALGPGARPAPALFIWREISVVYFGVLCCWRRW